MPRTIARYVITPALGATHNLTTWVARLFGGTKGNWGIAIILMTLLVKLIMFPLGRKQALMAQRTQELQPYLKEIQEKYKDEKTRRSRHARPWPCTRSTGSTRSAAASRP